jgi:outer membrane lipopolysaccharide assembly protein LptE/RlpB
MKLFLLLFVALLLSACGQKLNGTYADIGANMSTSLTFHGDKVSQKMWQGKDSSDSDEVEFTYKLDGNKIKVQLPGGGAIVLGTLQENGSIKGSMSTLGGVFIKQKD